MIALVILFFCKQGNYKGNDIGKNIKNKAHIENNRNNALRSLNGNINAHMYKTNITTPPRVLKINTTAKTRSDHQNEKSST